MRYAFFLPLAIAAGCSANNVSFTIDHFAEISTQTMCVVTPAGIAAASGLLDTAIAVQVRQGYVAAPVVGNHMVDRSSVTGAELDAIDVQGFNVTLGGDATTTSHLGAAALPYFVPANGGRINPTEQVAVPAEVIKADTAAALAGVPTPAGASLPTVIVNIRPVVVHDGSTIVGPASIFPVSICSNCLVENTGSCPSSAVSQNCFRQQDFAVACCTQTSGATCCGTGCMP